MEELKTPTDNKKKETNKTKLTFSEMPKKKKICLEKVIPGDINNAEINNSINKIEIADKLNLYKNKIEENDTIIKSLSESKTELMQRNSKIVEQFNNEKKDQNSVNLVISEIQNGVLQVHEHQNLLVDRLNTLEEHRVILENNQQKVFSQLNKLRHIGDNVIAEKNKQHEKFLTIYNELEIKYNKKSLELEKLNEKCLSLNKIDYANKQLTDELLELKDYKRIKDAEYDQLEENQKRINEEYIKSLNEIEIMKSSNNELLQNKKQLEESINQCNEKIYQLDQQYKFETSSLTNELEDKSISLDTLKNKIEMIYKANNNLNQCLNQSDNKYETLQKELQDLQTTYENTVYKTNGELERLRKDFNVETEKNIKLNNYCNTLLKQIDGIETANNSTNGTIEKLKAENQMLIQDVKKKNCDIYSLTLEIEKYKKKPDNSESFKTISTHYINHGSSISSIGSLRSNTIPINTMTPVVDALAQPSQRQLVNKSQTCKPTTNYDSDSSFGSTTKNANFIPTNILQKKFFNTTRNVQQNAQMSFIDRIRSSQKTNAACKDTEKK